MTPTRLVPTMLLLLAVTAATTARADDYRTFATRSGVTVPAVIVVAQNPKAVAILFAGGSGTLGIQPDGSIRSGGNFLVASRAEFAKQGIIAVVVDAPTDQTTDGRKMASVFRESAAHAEDVGLVVAALRAEFRLPVWLIGTSRGTTSVANAAIRLGNGGPDGIVLTSSISRDNRRGGNLLDMDLGRIRLPVLIVHHRNDGCVVSPFDGTTGIKQALVNAPVVDLLAFDGGKAPGDPCSPRAYHGYLGQRGKVVKAIADWISAH